MTSSKKGSRYSRAAQTQGVLLLLSVWAPAMGCADSPSDGGGASGGTGAVAGSGGTPTGGIGGGTGGASTGGGPAGGASAGGADPTGGVQNMGGLGGQAQCEEPPSAIHWCSELASEQREVCFTLEELNDTCFPTHLKSVHDRDAPADPAGGPTLDIEGDGGTELCPSAEELFWGDAGVSIGCFDVPACSTPTIQKGHECCYRALPLCRLK